MSAQIIDFQEAKQKKNIELMKEFAESLSRMSESTFDSYIENLDYI